MTADQDRAVSLAWKSYAEACCEHDSLHGQHACAELVSLIPTQAPDPVPKASSPTKG